MRRALAGDPAWRLVCQNRPLPTTACARQNMAYCLLDDLGVLRFRGADTQKFLQGQLSNDVGQLTAGVLTRAGLHNPQGRTLALLALLPVGQEDVLAILPRDLIASVATHMKRYVLRSQVTIVDETANLSLLGLELPEDAPAGEALLCRYGMHGDERRLLVRAATQPPMSGAKIMRERWRALDIAAGLPQVSNAISAAFVAQMLNLDCIEAISFTKGCYTGQEVIARAHYRGRVKRRMQRFVSTAPLELLAGASGRLDDGRAYRVVEATVRADGRCEFLAVAPLPGAAQDAEQNAQTDEVQRTAVSALPLPYPLPE
jgi:folate-binding protein YgfZ